MGNFDDLIQSGFWVIPKITLCKPIHGIIITVSTDLLNLETGKEITKNYKIITENWISWERKTYFIIFKLLSFAKI